TAGTVAEGYPISGPAREPAGSEGGGGGGRARAAVRHLGFLDVWGQRGGRRYGPSSGTSAQGRPDAGGLAGPWPLSSASASSLRIWRTTDCDAGQRRITPLREPEPGANKALNGVHWSPPGGWRRSITVAASLTVSAIWCRYTVRVTLLLICPTASAIFSMSTSASDSALTNLWRVSPRRQSSPLPPHLHHRVRPTL